MITGADTLTELFKPVENAHLLTLDISQKSAVSGINIRMLGHWYQGC
ncbi:hypothetical protein GMES_2006 [Paraglaciecola mesophila KMM 241]|uniref:Uncharacterized protein n=1 Tax=Paraglaciecola mesophila KMM 241 TaxID=1128912 RepID=K6Z1P2_9ALTE|nr:hypothetical protein GMES_2006 [Paraglaciecola mesophila KMM 241]